MFSNDRRHGGIRWGLIVIIFGLGLFWSATTSLVVHSLRSYRTHCLHERIFEEQVRAACPALLEQGLEMTHDECVEIFLESD